jgi:hypothetical protein
MKGYVAVVLLILAVGCFLRSAWISDRENRAYMQGLSYVFAFLLVCSLVWAVQS